MEPFRQIPDFHPHMIVEAADVRRIKDILPAVSVSCSSLSLSICSSAWFDNCLQTFYYSFYYH